MKTKNTTQTATRQSTDNARTSLPDKQCRESPDVSSLDAVSTTCGFNYGIRSTGNAGKGNKKDDLWLFVCIWFVFPIGFALQLIWFLYF